MNCKYCGAILPDNTSFCTNCGAQIDVTLDSRNTLNSALIGYSRRIHDPAFAAYLKNTKRWALIFSLLLAVASTVGFYIYGERSGDIDNPQALFTGLGIGALFLLIALLTIIGRKTSKTWDGLVIDKKIEEKTRRRRSGSDHNDYYKESYTEYAVIIRDQTGKNHYLTADDDDTEYNYYRVGDHVRHHGRLNSYEKYDKSKDTIIFCNACATLCDIGDDVCYRCKCPLLK